MKIAIVHQPIGTISSSDPRGGIELWIYEVARRLARSSEVIIYAKKGDQQKNSNTAKGCVIAVYQQLLTNGLRLFP